MKGYTHSQIVSLWEIAQSIRKNKPQKQKSFEVTFDNDITDIPTIKTYTPEQITAMGKIAAKHMRWNVDKHHRLLSKTKINGL